MADMYYKGHWYGADDREEFLDLIRVGESNVSGNIWEGGFLPPYTVAEAKEAYAMGLYHDRENGRTARKELSVYDAMMAEIYAEKERRLRKFERTHHADNSKKDKTKADRKRDKKIRMQKMYGLDAFEDTNHGKTVFYWDTKGGQKKFPEYEAEIFRNLKERSVEKSARAEEPAEYRVGWSEIDRMMYNADKIMREIRANIAEIPGAETHDEYWKDMNGEILFYEDEYYYRKAEWDYCYNKKIKGQKPDYADMCAMWEQISNAELHEWLKYA